MNARVPLLLVLSALMGCSAPPTESTVPEYSDEAYERNAIVKPPRPR